MNNILSDYIYDNTIKVIIENFSEEEIPEISFYYKKYLDNLYGNDIEMIEQFENKKDKFMNFELRKWSGLSKREKQVFLIKDDNLERLGYLSNLAMKYAIARLKEEPINNDLSMEVVQKYIDEMQSLVDKVRDFNREIAMTYCSEGIVDFNYALKLSNDMSFRVNRMR